MRAGLLRGAARTVAKVDNLRHERVVSYGRHEKKRARRHSREYGFFFVKGASSLRRFSRTRSRLPVYRHRERIEGLPSVRAIPAAILADVRLSVRVRPCPRS